VVDLVWIFIFRSLAIKASKQTGPLARAVKKAENSKSTAQAPKRTENAVRQENPFFFDHRGI
jgi:hypothetical protein